MVRAFRQSRLTAAGVFAAAAVLTILVWIRDRGLPVHIPLIASVLLLLLGVFAGLLAARLVADSCNTKLLGLLHVELDPDAFLRQYAEIPGRLRPDSREQLVACAYLADGYAAKGDFDAALAALSPLERAGLAGDAALRGLYLQDLCAYRLGKGDRAGAAQALEELEGLAAGCGEKQARLAQNLSGTAALLRARLTCLCCAPGSPACGAGRWTGPGWSSSFGRPPSGCAVWTYSRSWPRTPCAAWGRSRQPPCWPACGTRAAKPGTPPGRGSSWGSRESDLAPSDSPPALATQAGCFSRHTVKFDICPVLRYNGGNLQRGEGK